MSRTELARRYTVDELTAKARAIEVDPASRCVECGFQLFTPKARKKLDDLRWAIYYRYRQQQHEKSA